MVGFALEPLAWPCCLGRWSGAAEPAGADRTRAPKKTADGDSLAQQARRLRANSGDKQGTGLSPPGAGD